SGFQNSLRPTRDGLFALLRCLGIYLRKDCFLLLIPQRIHPEHAAPASVPCSRRGPPGTSINALVRIRPPAALASSGRRRTALHWSTRHVAPHRSFGS